LLSYLQAEVDERPEPGRFVLTGSQHLSLSQVIIQSLAGRTALLQLHPPSYPLDLPNTVVEVLDSTAATRWDPSWPPLADGTSWPLPTSCGAGGNEAGPCLPSPEVTTGRAVCQDLWTPGSIQGFPG
jgi:hypothetical protein